MAYTITRSHYLDLGGFPLDTTGWHIINLETALQTRTLRGSDRSLSGATGQRRRQRFLDQVVLQFELVVKGLSKWDGTAYSNAATGFQANCAEILANVSLGSSSAVTATYHGAVTLTASVDVVHLQFSDLGTFRDGKGVLELSLPAGKFT